MLYLLKWVIRDIVKKEKDRTIAEQLEQTLDTTLTSTFTQFELPPTQNNIQKAISKCQEFTSTLLPMIQNYINDPIIKDTKDIFTIIEQRLKQWKK